MNASIKSILKILAMSFFIFNSTISIVGAANIKSVIPSTTKIGIGTYIYESSIQQPMLIMGDESGSWSFINNIINTDKDKGGYLYNITCKNNICISTGAVETEPYYGRVNHRRPLFMISHDHGKTWSETNISNLPPIVDGIAPSISCISNVCTAVGWYQIKGGHNFPLLLSSNDNGQSWSYKEDIVNLPTMQDGSLSTITCSDNSCIAGGTYNISKNDKRLLFLTSKDRGQSWSFVQDSIDPPKMESADLINIKCNNNICIAVGNYSTRYDDAHALLLVSHDQGESWKNVKEIPDLKNLKDLFIEDMTFINGSFIAVGGYKKEFNGFLQSLILTTSDNGKSWSLVKDILGSFSKKTGWLRSVSCNSNICVAGGDQFYNGGINFGLTLLVSKDNGKSWLLIPNVAGASHTPNINVVQCSDNYCTAIGNFTDGVDYSHPVLLKSSYNGHSWSVIENILNFPKYIYEIKFSSMAIV
jgi:photosystem II stability/assembly factor-like uncharacterized protein